MTFEKFIRFSLLRVLEQCGEFPLREELALTHARIFAGKPSPQDSEIKRALSKLDSDGLILTARDDDEVFYKITTAGKLKLREWENLG
jgi:DNA-binding PadR family transcriptional regulator